MPGVSTSIIWVSPWIAIPERNAAERQIATLTLNRPVIHNAFDDLLIREITATLRDLRLDQPTIDPTTLTGEELVAEVQRVVKGLMGYGAKLPKELMLYVKNMVFLDGAIARLAPDLDLLAEITTICEYLEDIHPTPALIGSSPKEKVGTRRGSSSSTASRSGRRTSSSKRWGPTTRRRRQSSKRARSSTAAAPSSRRRRPRADCRAAPRPESAPDRQNPRWPP